MFRSRLPLVVTGVALVGCSPFDPDLGEQPFLCGTGDPRCPDGYSCVQRVGGVEVCQPSAGVTDAGGDSNLQCSGDMLEPNETISAPTLVSIAAGQTQMFDAALCPATDLDVYRLDVASTGMNVRVELTYEPEFGELAVDLLNSTGTLIRAAIPTTTTGEKLRADFNNVAQGVYFGRVHTAGPLNHYAISFTISGDTLPP